ncbi:signal peptidase II [Dongia sedimenti]|uniref:Lipoprotein signal peptidase n=1 Tax=Dongia sedimenti TaxID=3064282 RepID=A0ABU0YNG3_9PROT|nr:signal peptidase II [Rhodospirillaceae bacterium R-7]
MTFAIADKRLFRLGLILCAVIIVADQISKAIMMSVLEQHPYGIPILPVFSLVTAWNKGVSFSMLRNLPPEVLSGFAILVSLGLIYWLTRVENRLIAVGIGCVAGGALGNVIDRFRFGAVFDFLDFFIKTGSGWEWHWPAFNLADSAITVGVILLLIDGLFHRVDRAKTEHS